MRNESGGYGEQYVLVVLYFSKVSIQPSTEQYNRRTQGYVTSAGCYLVEVVTLLYS